MKTQPRGFMSDGRPATVTLKIERTGRVVFVTRIKTALSGSSTQCLVEEDHILRQEFSSRRMAKAWIRALENMPTGVIVDAPR